ncbi:Hydrogenase-4 component F homolog [Azospirillaceae bacterium]
MLNDPILADSLLTIDWVAAGLPMNDPVAATHVGGFATLMLLAIPAVAGAFFMMLPGRWWVSWINVSASLFTFGAALLLLRGRPETGLFFHIDDLNVGLILLTAFIGLTCSLYSVGYLRSIIAEGQLRPGSVRLYHALYQGVVFAMMLALSANNVGLMWVAIELGTLETVIMVGIYRSAAALEAAWKYFILGSVGVALALFGTILIYISAADAVGEGLNAMAWTTLAARAAGFEPALLDLSFVFILLGYGTKVGLAPLHAWLPDAHAEGPTPITAVLSGLLMNVAFYAVLRFKMVLAGNLQVLPPGAIMIGMGVLSVLFSGFMLYRRQEIKRLFAYSSIEHMGIASVAFGVGGIAANFAGLLHLAMHSLVKSAIFFAVGRIVQIKGTQRIVRIQGLIETHPCLAWCFIVSVLAIIGAPPFGLFVSEFLLITAMMGRYPWATSLLIVGLLLAMGVLVRRLNGVVFGERQDDLENASEEEKVLLTERRNLGEKAARSFRSERTACLPMAVHLLLALAAGVALPAAIAAWLKQVARLLG